MKATDLSSSVKMTEAHKRRKKKRHPLGFSRSARAPPSLTCDVIDYHGDSGVTDVAGDETPETLLPGRVPKLQAHLREPAKVPKIQQEGGREGEEEVVREDRSERTERGAKRKQGRE